MRIVLATPLYPPEIGGPATYAEVLVRTLSAQGVTLELVKFSDVRHLPKIVRHIAYYRKLVRAGRVADAIFALDPVSVGLPAYLAARTLKKPLFVKIVGDYAWEQGVQRFGVSASLDAFVAQKSVPFLVRILRAIQLRVAQAATKIIVPSAYLKYVVSTWGVREEKIKVIYNAVPMEPAGALPTAVQALPRPLVVSVGRLVPWKGFEGLIEALQVVREAGTRASLVIVGDGPDRATIQASAEEALGRATMHLNKYSRPETLAIIKNADAFVLNSSYEGLSHTLIEALSLGAPIVATRAGGNGEVIADSKNGLLVPVGDTAHLAHALMNVLHDRALRTRLSETAKASASRFAEDTMVRETAQYLLKP